MSGNQQALLMAGGGSSAPPVQTCVGDPYYALPENDPFFSSVILLLYGNGANGGTTFTDSSSRAVVPDAISNVETSTLQTRFSTASIRATTTPALLSYNSNTAYQRTASGTIEFWLYRTANVAAVRYIVSRSATSFASINNTTLTFTNMGNANATVSITSLPLNAWTHIVFCWDSTSQRTYINGVFSSSGAAGTAPAGASPLNILGVPGRLDLASWSSGFIANFRWTSGVARYVGNFIVPSAAFPAAQQVGWLDQLTVLSLHCETLVDSSSQPKIITLGGTAAFSAGEGVFGTSALNVISTGGFTLNGITVNSDQTFRFGTADWTLETWAKRTANTNLGTLFAATTDAFSVTAAAGTGVLGWNLTSSLGSTGSRTPGFAFPVGTYVYLVVQRRGSNIELYADGVLIDSVAVPGGPSATITWATDIFVGKSANSSFTNWTGFVDDLRLTRGVARYSGAFTPPTLTFCDSVNSQFTGQVNGTDFPRGQEVVSSQGTMRVLNPWVRLQGQQLLSTQGSLTGALPNRTFALTGQQIQAQTGVASPPGKTVALSGARVDVRAGALRVPPYPDLVSSVVAVGSQVFPGTGVPAAVAVFSTDGTYTVTYAGGSVRTGNWIDVAGSSYNIADIASQYSIRTAITAYPSLVSASSPFPAPLGATLSFFTIRGIGAIGIGVIIAPKTNNPRYGEPGYVSETNIQISIED